MPAPIRRPTCSPREPALAAAIGGVRELLARGAAIAPRRDRVRRDADAYRWCFGMAMAEGYRHGSAGQLLAFKTTWSQIAGGLGYPTSGDYDADLKWETPCRRALDSLEELGLIVRRPVRGGRRPGQAFYCQRIIVRDAPLRRALAAAMPRRRARAPRRPGAPETPPQAAQERRRSPSSSRPAASFFDRRQVVSPLRERKLHKEASRARQAAPAESPSGSARRAPSLAPQAAPTSSDELGDRPGEPLQGGSNGAVDRAASLSAAARRGISAGHSPTYLLCDAYALLFDQPARLSWRRWARRLERALARLEHFDRHRRPGVGLDTAIALLVGNAEHAAATLEPPPGSLAYFVPVLEELANDWRRTERPRRRAARRARPDAGHVRRKMRDWKSDRAAEAARS